MGGLIRNSLMFKTYTALINKLGNYKMSVGRRQHIVPQQMIRRFTNDNGQLFELYKPKLSIGKKPKRPRGILFRDYYYDDKIASFDKEILQPIENRFGKHYAEIADKPWKKKIWDGEVGAAFIDWVAAQLCRTTLTVEMNKVLFKKENPLLAIAYEKDTKLADNIIRSGLFEHYQDFLARPLWKWKCRIFPDDFKTSLVITDNPVCKVLGFGKAAGALMVPLSKRRILFGEKKEIVEKCGDISIRDINFCLAAWADSHIFAADKKTLKDIVIDLRGEGTISGPPEVFEEAQKSFFGLPERAATNPVSESIDLDKFWETLKDSFGPSVLDPDKEVKDNAD